MIEAFSEIFRFSANVLGNLHDPLNRLIVLDFLLYTFVSAAGPMWQCSAAEVQWSCPPRCFVPALNLLRKIFSWPHGSLGLAESLAGARLGLNGPGALAVAFLGVVLLMIFAEDGIPPVPVTGITEGGSAYSVLGIVALILGCGSLLIVSRNVVRALVCVEYALAVGKNNGNDAQKDAACNQEKVQEDHRNTAHDFKEAARCAFAFPSWRPCSKEGAFQFGTVGAGCKAVFGQNQCPYSRETGEQEFSGASGRERSSIEGRSQGCDAGEPNTAAVIEYTAVEYTAGCAGRGGLSAIEVRDKTAEKREQTDDTPNFERHDSISGNVWGAPVTGRHEDVCRFMNDRVQKEEEVNVSGPTEKGEPLRRGCSSVLGVPEKKFHWSFLLLPVLLLFAVFPLLRAKVEVISVSWGRRLMAVRAELLDAFLVPLTIMLVLLLGLTEMVCICQSKS